AGPRAVCRALRHPRSLSAGARGPRSARPRPRRGPPGRAVAAAGPHLAGPDALAAGADGPRTGTVRTPGDDARAHAPGTGTDGRDPDRDDPAGARTRRLALERLRHRRCARAPSPAARPGAAPDPGHVSARRGHRP